MRLLLFFLGLFLFTGCHVGPYYEPPPLVAPNDWKCGACQEVCPAPVENWWEIFQDPLLNSLECQALQASPNIYVSYYRILEARGIVDFERANFIPDVTLRPNYTVTERLFELLGVPGGIVPGLQTVFRARQQQYVLPLDMRYQVDLWGRFRNQYLTVLRYMESLEEDFMVTLLTVSTDLASHYFNVRAIDSQSLFYIKEIELRRKNLDLVQTRFKEGLVSRLDVSSAELLLTDLEANYSDVLRQRGLYEDAIAVLIGVFAPEFFVPFNPLELPPPSIPPGVPCSILVKRPDIREAERRRAAANGLIGIIQSSFLPQLTLSETFGFFSPTLKDFLTWKSRLWTFAVDIVQYVFDGGRREALLGSAWARFNQEDWKYQSTVLTAFQEVQDALNDLEWQEKQFRFLKESTVSANERSSLSLTRYLEGLTNYLDVIDSERSQAEAEVNLTNTLGSLYQSTVQLIKALGGSWECPTQGLCIASP